MIFLQSFGFFGIAPYGENSLTKKAYCVNKIKMAKMYEMI